MRVYFEDRKDAYAFLKLCKLIAYVLEENEKVEKWSKNLIISNTS